MLEVGTENHEGETQTLGAYASLAEAYAKAKQMIDNPELIGEHVEIEGPYVQIFIDRFVNDTYEAAVWHRDLFPKNRKARR